MLCYCKSQKKFTECCEPFLSHKAHPSTPEELMRSRYSAFVLGDGRYIVETTSQNNRSKDDITLIQEYAKSVEWLGLEILSSEQNSVTFKAYYRDANTLAMQHEKSFFIQENGVWFYTNGILYDSKIQRNAPCPCGSTKKYKKCCAD